MPITPIQPNTGTFESNSGSATLAATEEGSQVIIVAGVVGTGIDGDVTKVSTPSGFFPLGVSAIGDTHEYGLVQMFIKPSTSSGETSFTLTLTNSESRRVVWAAFEFSGLDVDFVFKSYLAAISETSGVTTTVTSKQVTSGNLSETFAGLSLAGFLAVDTGGTTPTVSGYTDGFAEAASQSGTDTGSRAATLSVAMKTELAVNTPTTTATISPTSYVATYLVVLTGLDSHHAPNLTAMSGLGFGTATSMTTTGPSSGALAPFDGVTGAPEIDTTNTRGGSFSLKIASTSAAENATWISGAGKNLQSATVQTWSGRLHVHFGASLPTVDVDIHSVEVGSLANGMRIWYRTADQKLGVKIGTGTEVLSDATVSAGQHIGIDYLYDPRTTTHTCQWTVDYDADIGDTTAAVAQSAATTAGMTSGGITTVRFGHTEAVTATYWMTDLAGSRVRKTYPIGDIRIVTRKVDPDATPTVSGDPANFRTFTANGTLAAWTAAATITTLDDVPPVVGASADGIAQITNASTEYVHVPMQTYDLAGNDVVAVGGRWYWAGWAASGNPATFRFRPYDGVLGSTIFGETVDAGFDNSSLIWMGMIHNSNAQLNSFYSLTQAKLDALAAQFGFGIDQNPDAGALVVLFELALKPAGTEHVFGDPAGTPRVEQRTNPDSGGLVSLDVYTSAESGATVRYYDAADTPTEVAVPAASSPYVITVNAEDVPSYPRIEMTPA